MCGKAGLIRGMVDLVRCLGEGEGLKGPSSGHMCMVCVESAVCSQFYSFSLNTTFMMQELISRPYSMR